MIRFLHAADCHLEYRPELGQSANLRERIRIGTQEAFKRLIDLAIQEAVDFIVFPGDLYNSQERSLQILLFLKDQFQRLQDKGIQVYISYGNHDFESSPTQVMNWSPNVHIFDTQVETKTFENIKGERVAISGFSYPTRWVKESQLSEFPTKDADVDWHIGLYHGDLASSEVQDKYAPFTIDEMSQKQYDYWALGHIHKRQSLSIQPAIYYSGSLQARNRKEVGDKGVYLVTLKADAMPQVDFHSTATFQFINHTITILKAESIGELNDQVMQQLEQIGNEHAVNLELILGVAVDADVREVIRSTPHYEQQWLPYLISHLHIKEAIEEKQILLNDALKKHFKDVQHRLNDPHQQREALEELMRSPKVREIVGQEILEQPSFWQASYDASVNLLSQWIDDEQLAEEDSDDKND
ncbi:metallophosphoesterase family protein [Atopobacter phocae]|uniref:metallophosphoesterase family protein n=1 Tax=Atopobacter phocae TaxID=136492 RepID=UPI0004BA0F00|nr:DNA repair exonuclease [Atopobacter phocae]